MPVLWFGGGVFLFKSLLPSEGLQRVERRLLILAVYLSWSEKLRMGGKGEIFYLPVISQDPFLYFAEQEGSLPMLSDQQIHIFFVFFQTKCSLEGSDMLTKDIPKHEAVLLGLSCQWSFSFLPSQILPTPKQRAPLHKGWDYIPAVAITGTSILICSPPLNSPLRVRNKQCSLRYQRHRRDLAFRSKIEWLLEEVTTIT